MAGWESDIIRVNGYLNTVNDTYIGGAPAGSIGLSASNTNSLYAGQLGKALWLGPEQIGPMFNSTIGTLYPGRFRYVKLRSADITSPAIGIGEILFWDTTVTNWQTAYQVTRDENLSSVSNAVMIAGIYIGGFVPGNYGFIQDVGMVKIRFRAVLTASGAVGSQCYAAGAGDTGSDQGTADVLTTDSTAIANTRFLGNATTAPGGGSLTPVILNLKNPIG